MARSLFYRCLLLAAAACPLTLAAEPFWNIKSRASSGNGCPSTTWIYVDYGFRREFLQIGYPDFKPEVSPSQPIQHATSVCQLILELDQLPAGYQFAVTGITHFAQVYIEQWIWWRQWFATRVGFGEDGPFSRVCWIFREITPLILADNSDRWTSTRIWEYSDKPTRVSTSKAETVE